MRRPQPIFGAAAASEGDSDETFGRATEGRLNPSSHRGSAIDWPAALTPALQRKANLMMR
jgi:hypothetical protein